MPYVTQERNERGQRGGIQEFFEQKVSQSCSKQGDSEKASSKQKSKSRSRTANLAKNAKSNLSTVRAAYAPKDPNSMFEYEPVDSVDS